jgi:S1-C subfamily serine protease
MRSILTHAAASIVTIGVLLVWQSATIGTRTRAQVASAPAVETKGEGQTIAAALANADPEEQTNIKVYAATNGGVVHITTESSTPGFFGDEIASGSGSGFVLDREGHILTNYHVVSEADSLVVKLADGSSHGGKVIGVDPSNDIAVVLVEGVAPEKWVPLPFGDSSKLVVGMRVLAVGNPFGLERTLTTGIVSSLDRSIKAKNGRTIKGIIQTDAAINPGNSGGPLLNSRGEVIGMNTAIVSQVNQYSGISFAVPINVIARILPQLLRHGRVIRADLGISRIFATERGIYVVEIVRGGAAERAGLRPMEVVAERVRGFVRTRINPEAADRIVAVDGAPVRTADDLLSRVESHRPGEKARLTIVRAGRQIEVDVVLGESDQ